MQRGRCLCGAVSFEIEGELPDVEACHCSQCRRQSGHYWAAVDVPNGAVTIHGGDRLTWYRSSETIRRGFCSTCGSFLFWDRVEKDGIGVAAGALDPPTGARLGRHIFVADKGDYYEIDDGVPQNLR